MSGLEQIKQLLEKIDKIYESKKKILQEEQEKQEMSQLFIATRNLSTPSQTGNKKEEIKLLEAYYHAERKSLKDLQSNLENQAQLEQAIKKSEANVTTKEKERAALAEKETEAQKSIDVKQSGIKAQKQESQNLAAMIIETDKEITTLKETLKNSKAEKNEAENSLKSELSNKEKSALLKEKDSLKNEIAAIEDELKTPQPTGPVTRGKAKQSEDNKDLISTKQKALVQKKARLSVLQSKLSKIETLEAKIKALEHTIKKIEETELPTLNNKMTELRQALKDNEESINTTQEEMKTLESMMADNKKEIQDLTAEIEQAKEASKQLEERLGLLRNEQLTLDRQATNTLKTSLMLSQMQLGPMKVELLQLGRYQPQEAEKYSRAMSWNGNYSPKFIK